jgi:hypothetical protein
MPLKPSHHLLVWGSNPGGAPINQHLGATAGGFMLLRCGCQRLVTLRDRYEPGGERQLSKIRIIINNRMITRIKSIQHHVVHF